MNELQTNWDWASHVPVLKYFIENHDIDFAVEHGTGMHSTPILLKAKKYIGFEENEEFRQTMIDTGVYTESIRNLAIPEGVELFTRYDELTDENKAVLDTIYKDLYKTIKSENNLLYGYSMLLVDGYSCSRNVCMNTLYDLFDIIIIHDTEEGSYDYYNYTFNDELWAKDYKKYTVTTSNTSTTILIFEDAEGVNIDLNLLREYLDDFCDELEFEHSEMDIII